MTMILVKLSYNSKLVPDPGLVLQTPLCSVDLCSFWQRRVNLKAELPQEGIFFVLNSEYSLP